MAIKWLLNLLKVSGQITTQKILIIISSNSFFKMSCFDYLIRAIQTIMDHYVRTIRYV